MSEQIYRLLLRLYPSRFRAAYETDALLLFRDRARHEQGFIAKLRLWIDILADTALSLPQQYIRLGPTFAPAPSHFESLPHLEVLPSPLPQPRAILSGTLLSLLAFGSLFVWIGHGRNFREFHTLPGFARPSAFPPDQQLAGPKPQPATAAVIQALSSHDIVMYGEIHANKQEYEWLCKLVQDPQFAAHVDDIVIEFGNSLYQKSVDRYIAGEDIPIEQVQKAWRNLIGAVGPPSPVYGEFYKAVRDGNLQRHGTHQIRLVLGDPYGDWDKINNAEDLGPYVANRDQWYAQVVKDEVLSRHHHALLIMGAGHFLRHNGPGYVERTIRAAGADPYLIVIGTNVTGSYDDLDPRFDSWPVPSITSLAGNWVGVLPAMPVVTLGFLPPSPLKLVEATDAMLYVGPRDSLTQVNMPPSELDGTPYGKEIARRFAIQTGHASSTIHFDLPPEVPQARRPPPQSATNTNRPQLPPPPLSFNGPLPPRPPSQ